MSATREFSRAAMQAIRVPTPTRADRTLKVGGVPAGWPPIVAAVHVVRVALELGCTTIEVQQSGRSTSFDAVDLAKAAAIAVGYWPRPRLRRPGPVRGLALAGFRGLGAAIERSRQWVSVPRTGTAPVSG